MSEIKRRYRIVDGEEDHKHPICCWPECPKQATYGDPKTRKRLFCKQHCNDGDIHLSKKIEPGGFRVVPEKSKELRFKAALETDFELVHNRKFDRFYPDFRIGTNTIVEIDEFAHSAPGYNDDARDKELMSKISGLTIIHVNADGPTPFEEKVEKLKIEIRESLKTPNRGVIKIDY